MAVGLLSLATAPGASAATEVGNACQANNGAPGNFTLLQLTRAPGAPLPLTIQSPGVVTKWKVNSAVPSAYIERLKVFRSTGIAKEFTVVGESTEQSVATGLNAFDTRIPVAAGDRFGVSSASPSASLFCETGKTEDGLGVLPENLAVGSTKTFSEVEGNQIAVSAVVEPDVDGDGYGDETQDKCPQSAALQTECPIVAVDSFSLIKKSSVVLLVATSSQAPVEVSGTVKLGKGKQIKLSGGTQTVPSGKIARFKLKFSKKLKARLEELPSSKSLQLKVAATATDIAGRVTVDPSKVKLKGQA
jgi:hypothetical protein